MLKFSEREIPVLLTTPPKKKPTFSRANTRKTTKKHTKNNNTPPKSTKHPKKHARKNGHLHSLAHISKKTSEFPLCARKRENFHTKFFTSKMRKYAYVNPAG